MYLGRNGWTLPHPPFACFKLFLKLGTMLGNIPTGTIKWIFVAHFDSSFQRLLKFCDINHDCLIKCYRDSQQDVLFPGSDTATDHRRSLLYMCYVSVCVPVCMWIIYFLSLICSFCTGAELKYPQSLKNSSVKARYLSALLTIGKRKARLDT